MQKNALNWRFEVATEANIFTDAYRGSPPPTKIFRSSWATNYVQRWGDIQWWWWCWIVWMVSNQSVACHPHFSLSVTASCLGHDPLVSSLIWSPWLIITLTLTMLSKIFVIRVHFMFCTVIKRRWRAGKRFAAKSYFPNPEAITVQ